MKQRQTAGRQTAIVRPDRNGARAGRNCLTAYIERCLGNIDAGGNGAKRGSSAKPLTRAAAYVEQTLVFPGLKFLGQPPVVRGNFPPSPLASA